MVPAVLRRTSPPTAAHVRGIARLLHGGAAIRQGGRGLWLYRGFVPGPLPPVPPGPAGVLRSSQAGASPPAARVRGARSRRQAAQAEPLHLRDQRGPEG